MHATPVLLVTDDDLLWQHWRGLDAARWLPARGRGLASLQQWQGQGRQLVVLDASVARLPAWDAPQWQELTAGLRLVVASSRPSDAQGTQVFAAGAYGYCHSHAPLASLMQVLEVVSGGGIWMGRSLVTRLLKLVDERVPSAPAPLAARPPDRARERGGAARGPRRFQRRHRRRTGHHRTHGQGAPVGRLRKTGRVGPPATGAVRARHFHPYACPPDGD